MKRMRLRKSLMISIKGKILLILFIIFILTYILLKTFGKDSIPFLYEYAESEAINISNILINKAIYDEIYNNKNKDIVLIEKMIKMKSLI